MRRRAKGALFDRDTKTRASLVAARCSVDSRPRGGAAGNTAGAGRRQPCHADADDGGPGCRGRWAGALDRDDGAATDPEDEGTPTGFSDHDTGANADAAGTGTP
ncbi:hypothetical protein [Pararhodobacter sp.]|uniref:hypothetical protein n=1 Tax=Pararhodobacter sp. TaxID=2127056 RepID=UPI002AFF1913|nr:hypothetical protein [Pararhodobacter sp.]